VAPNRLRETPDPANAGPSGFEADGDDVDAAGSGGEPTCRLPQPTPLLPGELDQRVGPHPSLHLDGHHDAVEPDQEVDLTSPRTNVAGDRDRPSTTKERQGRLLADLA
jgi:hypothetical protein